MSHSLRTKTLFAVATTVLITLGALTLPAQAGRTVPAPQRSPDAQTHDRRDCYTPVQVSAVMAGGIAKRLYLQTYRHHYTGENNSRIHGIGVKANDQWFSFEVETCQGAFVRETPLPGRPSNL
jgi:hypothetical protein